MKLSQLKIDPEFQSKIPPLQFEEEQQLEQNIIAEGRLLNPIITWNGYILDGHTRYRILKKHGFIKFEVEEILTGHIKATDEQIVALASIPKKERPAILEELKKKKSDRDDTILERLKPSKPPPKPKSAPQKKKPTATENNTALQAEQPETSVQAPITESPPEEEIEPTSNAPPSFLQSIQGHKRHLSEEDKARLKASVDARYKDKATATGSIMLCELQGATEDFIFRWNVVFQEHPEVLIDKVCQKKLSELMDRMMSYLKTVKEEKL